MSRKTEIIVASVILSLLLIGGAFLVAKQKAKYVEKADTVAKNTVPTVGEVKSEHSHSTILVFINGTLIDFTKAKYQSQSPIAHFEDGNGTTLHKHATGVTLPLFFSTLGMKLDSDCILFEGTNYCTDQTNHLSIFINGIKANDFIASYELHSHDKILVNYGPENEVDLALRRNLVPDTGENF